uniref:uncharacterized protein LOC124050547 n=1 Tax=Scatophagus argus TaxID=75038 RepID=UPI001ED812EF|nr:uncharacterized protein LOC124050547 [Scatophagus argus]XP_046229181.1 uncharacterized protein LOC124050547 [Scatophagus argus]
MERNKKTHLLFLLLALHLCDTAVFQESCPSITDKNIICYTDYNHTISCVWNSTHGSDRGDTECTLHAKSLNIGYGYNSSCKLEPVDIYRPMMKKCSMTFKTKWIVSFQSFHELKIDLSCNDAKQNLNFLYKPACHIKLNPPPVPNINFTTISWLTQDPNHRRITEFASQLQWKKMDQSWSDPRVNKTCKEKCETKLDPDDLIEGERYEARVRVKENKYVSTWSDWSPTASWVSLIGRQKSSATPSPPPPPPPLGIVGGVLGSIACTVMLAFLLIIFRTDKTWIYIVKRIRGPPLPNPGKSFLQNVTFQSPHFTKESFHSFLNPVEIVPVEVTSTLDGVAPIGLEATLLEKMRSESSHDSTSSSFTNPIYSQLSPPAPVLTFTVGNLEACVADTPYGPVGCQCEDKNAEQDMGEVRGKEVEILQLFSKCSNNSKPTPVISDYEKVEKPQVERFRLQSLDSGVCSGEEVSQESLEADSINVTDCNDEEPEIKEEKEGGNGKEIDFKKLFGTAGRIFDSGSIQVCSGYEQVQKLPADSPELPSLDSGISSGGEEQVSQESLEDVDKSTESTSLLFPPPPAPFSTACSLSSFTPLPFNFFGAGLGSAQSHVLERIAQMSTNRSMEPSGDGYMPARQ